MWDLRKQYFYYKKKKFLLQNKDVDLKIMLTSANINAPAVLVIRAPKYNQCIISYDECIEKYQHENHQFDRYYFMG